MKSDAPTVYRLARTLAVTALLVAALAAGATPSTAGGAAGFETVTIPLELSNGIPAVRCRLNDSEPFYAALDTGSQAILVDRARASEAGLRTTGTLRGRGAGGEHAAAAMTGATLRLEGLALRVRGSVVVFDLHGPTPCQDGPVAGALIGSELFKSLVVELDFEGRRMTLRDPRTFVYSGKGVEVPLSLRNDLPEIRATFTVPGRAPAEGRFLVDTGFNGTLLLDHSSVSKHRVLEAVPRTLALANKIRAFGGSAPAVRARLDEMRVAGLALERPIALLLHKSEAGFPAGPDGIVGSGFLKRFTVIFDYSRKRMILEPNSRYGEPFEATMTGLSLVDGPAGAGGFRVCGVAERTPADAAGIRPGDVLVEIDGKSTAEMSLEEARQLLRRAGAVYALAMRRGGHLVRVSLEVRELL